MRFCAVRACLPAGRYSSSALPQLCPGRDLNPQPLRDTVLSRTRLPAGRQVFQFRITSIMGREGFEPSTLTGYGSEPYAYANSATCPLFNKLFKNSLPIPDFKYFSRTLADTLSGKVSVYISLKGA